MGLHPARRPAAVLGAVLLAACSAGPRRAAPADPQSDYEPRSAPGSGQAFLARMAGDFEVRKTFFRQGGGEPVVTMGRCRQAMIHGGRFLQSDFVFASPQGDSTGTGIIGFDAETGRFTSFWVDSRSTRASLRQSEGTFDGQQIELWSRTLDGDAAARRSRTETRFGADDRTLVHRQFRVGADGKETLVMELLLTRRAGPN